MKLHEKVELNAGLLVLGVFVGFTIIGMIALNANSIDETVNSFVKEYPTLTVVALITGTIFVIIKRLSE